MSTENKKPKRSPEEEAARTLIFDAVNNDLMPKIEAEMNAIVQDAVAKSYPKLKNPFDIAGKMVSLQGLAKYLIRRSYTLN